MTEKVITELLEINDLPNRELIIEYLYRSVYSKFYHSLKGSILSTDLIKHMTLAELRDYNKYINDKRVFVSEEANNFWDPSNLQLETTRTNKLLVIEEICAWVGADLYKFYYYDAMTCKISIIDRMEILRKNSSRRHSYLGCDSDTISKLLDCGMIILKILRYHYIVFFKLGTNYVIVSTTDDARLFND